MNNWNAIVLETKNLSIGVTLCMGIVDGVASVLGFSVELNSVTPLAVDVSNLSSVSPPSSTVVGFIVCATELLEAVSDVDSGTTASEP